MSEIYNRELSWLSFNHRVLQEAKDNSVPLYERIKFLAIFSSNLDEFFRVRVASLRSLIDLKNKKKKLKFNPSKLLRDIHKVVNKQQKEFGEIFREEIIPELNKNGIYLIKDGDVTQGQREYLHNYFCREVIPNLNPSLIAGGKISLFLKNNAIYLTVRLQPLGGKNGDNGTAAKTNRYAILEIPVEKLSRFVVLPPEDGKNYIMFLDDVIRLNLPLVFPGYNILEAYSVKLTRDAELYIDDEFTGNLLEKIKGSLSKRKTGVPCRFLYDEAMPKDFLKYIRKTLQFSRDDIIPGGRYHNFYDFFTFPNPGKQDLQYEPMPPLKSSAFSNGSSFDAIKKGGILTYYPYNTFEHVIKFIEEASSDKDVQRIKITLYRTAKESAIIKALVSAARKGKDVTAFIEIKARFDEELNFQNADELEKGGVKVLYSFPGMKVHSKMCLVSRTEEEQMKNYAYLSTGNFNEKTAKLYSDIGFFTADEALTAEVEKVFNFLSREKIDEDFAALSVAPFNLRKNINELIDIETANASEGKKALIILKLNSLEDKKVIRKLYEAAEAGVKIKIMVRGICCMVPDKKRNIEIRSIIDRYLEHSRIYYFYNGGEEKMFIASADFMTRNFDRRIELLIPINKAELKKELKTIISIYFKDNIKARRVSKTQNNRYVKTSGTKKIQVQYELYRYLKEEKESEPDDTSSKLSAS